MTVKLAKLFSNSNTTTSAKNPPIAPQHYQHHHQQASQQPPPLPPPNPPQSYSNYYQQKQHQHMPHLQSSKTSQKPYNPYMDDEDDNMSLYSTTASIMTSRDHPFNSSQRPLLAERKPQLLLAQSSSKKKHQQQQTAHQQQQQQQQQYHQPPQQQQKSYISPYVQQQKRDSAKGLHGFNDFDILSQQYNQHLQSPHIGYPYGSPPSPTHPSDFVFETTTNNENLQQQQQLNHHFAGISTALTSTPRYGNITNYGSTTLAASGNNFGRSSTPCYDVNEADYCGKSSRFEDDFCTRRNIDFAKSPATSSSSSSAVNVLNHNSHLNVVVGGNVGGPFIFGVPPEHQTDFARIPAGGRSFGDISEDSGITKDDDKYSTKGRQQASDTSSTSRDESTTLATCNSHDGSSQASNGIAINSNSNSNNNNSGDGVEPNCRKGAAKFLLRKRKTKKTIKETQCLKSQKKPCVKCVVVGDCAVGKTNLILSYLENRFNTEHVPTASDIYNADVMVNDSPVHLTLCDTAGQDTLDPLRELCYPDSDVFLLCFSVAKPETFHAIKTKWAPRLAKTKASLILVGTQADLRTNPIIKKKLQSNGAQSISYADAWDLATTIGAKYIETSSATQDKVKEVFDTAIWEGLAPTTLPPTPPPLWKRLLCLA